MFTIDRSKPFNVTGNKRSWWGYCAKCGRKVRVRWLVGFLHECVDGHRGGTDEGGVTE